MVTLTCWECHTADAKKGSGYCPECFEKKWSSRTVDARRIKAWQRQHPERLSERIARNNFLRRLHVLGHYSRGTFACAYCGIANIDVLCMDHVNGDGRAHRDTLRRDIYSWLKANDYPLGFQVLCHNCNYKKGLLERQARTQRLATR